MKVAACDANGLRWWQETGSEDVLATDVRILTSGGQSIPAHSTVLSSASPVLGSMLDQQVKRGSSEKVIEILGVPHEAVLAFVRFLYSARCGAGEDDKEMERYGVHLLVLSHVYRVGWLKWGCEAELGARLSAESAVDMLQLGRLCDAPRLCLWCLRLMAKDFASVQKTEAWRFLQAHDPWLELHILQFLRQSDLRMKQRRRKREEQVVYQELNEAMDCLRHICTEGCTDVRPYDREPPSRSKGPCSFFPTCAGLQLLIRHFATCERMRATGRCCRCKRMLQLLRLHSSICDQPESCKVPLCTKFKLRTQHIEEEGGDERWRLLVRKVALAKVTSFLDKRKRLGQLIDPWVGC